MPETITFTDHNNGVEFRIWWESSRCRWFVRVRDTDANETVGIKTFPKHMRSEAFDYFHKLVRNR